MSDEANGARQFPPGWYPDAAAPGRERWWDGAASTKYTAAIPKNTPFGLAYVHAMRIGANRILVPTRILLAAAFLLLLFLLFTVRPVLAGAGESGEFLAVNFVALASCVVTIVLGVLGLRRARQLGGKGVAIWAIATGGAFGLLLLLPLAFVLGR